MKERLHLDQSSYIRHLLYEAIKEDKIKHAIDEYKLGKISFGKASEIAGLSLWEFIDEAHRRNVQLNFSLQDAENEIKRIKGSRIDEFMPGCKP
ncbi:MAG: UPF0175 family protein [Candidatus Lokiarchaeota archaeon]|nr:UPF0175 family protein [Candidatus Lokiarchaeota archaeon]